MAFILLDKIQRRWVDIVLILLMDILYAFSFFQRVAVPGVIFDHFQSEFALSSAGVALLGAIYLYVYGGLQIPVGLAIDRFDATRVIIIGGGMLTLGSIAFPLSHNVAMLYTTRLFVGLGASLMFLSVVKEIDNNFSNRSFSMLLGGSSFIGYIGGLMGTFPFERSVSTIGWRMSLLWAGIGCGVAAVGILWLARKAPKVAQTCSQPNPTIALKRIFKNRQSYPVFGTVSIVFGTYFVVQGVIGSKLLQDCYALKSSVAASYMFLMMIATMASVGVSGFLPALIGNRRKPIIIGMACGTAAATAGIAMNLSMGHDPRWTLACYLLLGISVGNNAIYTCSIKELNWGDAAATSVGVQNSICYLSVALLVTLTGWALDLFKATAVISKSVVHYPADAYRLVFIGLCTLSIVAIVLASFVRETRGENKWEACRKQEKLNNSVADPAHT